MKYIVTMHQVEETDNASEPCVETHNYVLGCWEKQQAAVQEAYKEMIRRGANACTYYVCISTCQKNFVTNKIWMDIIGGSLFPIESPYNV
jgi:hypothetical protein